MITILEIINKDYETLAYLNNIENGTVREVINGEYVISFTAIIEELKTDFLYDKNNLIKYDNDYFNIISIEEEHTADNMLKVYVNCEHISYDLIEQTKLEYVENDRSAIYVMNDILKDTGFTFLGTDVTTTNSINIDKEIDIKSLLYLVATIWGGELKYFQKTIELKQQLGINRGADFRFGKNLQSIKRLIDRVENTVSYEIEVVQGSELQELGYFEIGDTIRVVDDMLKIEIDTRIIETEKDIVTGLNSRVILGQPIKDLSNSFNNILNTVNQLNVKVDNNTIDLNNAINNAITNVYGDIGSIYDNIDGINTDISGINTDITGIDNNIANIQLALEDGIITTYYQDTPPTDVNEGDLWFKTDENKLYLRNNNLWKLIEDAGITEAIQKAQDAQTTADGKIVSFYQDNIPTNANVGDLWIDTNDGNKLYRFNGTNWISARDGSLALIDNVLDEHGNLIASKLSGALNTAITKVENSTSTVSFDDRGIITHNQPLESTSVKAMLLTSDGILIANAKNTDGTWKWRTAITADGISADEINTGTLTAIDINGVTIKGSDITSDDANSEIKLNNGVLSVKKKATSQQFNINYRAGLPANILQSELEYYNEFKASNPNKPAENTISLNSANSHMGLEFGNGAVSVGNDWVKQGMYGGTTDWQTAWTTLYNEYYAEHQDDSKYNPPPDTAQGSKLNIDFAGTYWVYREREDFGSGYVMPAIILGNSYFNINPHYFNIDCIKTEIGGHLEVGGNFSVGGTKNCRIKTEKYGDLDYSAYETAEILLGDVGENEVVDGECFITLDEKLLACVNTDIPYQVFLQAYGDGKVYVAERNKTSFTVKGDNIKFVWEVKAKRKNYENIRFGQPIERIS